MVETRFIASGPGALPEKSEDHPIGITLGVLIIRILKNAPSWIDAIHRISTKAGFETLHKERVSTPMVETRFIASGPGALPEKSEDH